MLFPWSNEPLLEINPSHAAPQTKFGQTCDRFKHLGIPPQTPVDSYFFKHISPNQNNKTKFTHVWNLSCQEILISCFMLNLWWVDWAYSVQNCFVFPKLFIVNFCLMTESQRNISLLRRNDTMRVRIFPPEISKEHLQKFRWQRKRSAKMNMSHYS